MNCNNCTNNNALKEVKIKHVQGNVLRMAIPLTLRTIELVDGEINATDTPFVPSSEHPVKVVFSKKGSVSVALDATMKDGNIAYIEEKGKIPVGTYAITVTCNDDNGNPYRFKQNAVLYVADATIEAGIEETIEYEVTTWYLDAAIFLALKGEDGVGIYDIETQSSGEIGGVNTVTFILTDGRTRSFNILNGSGAVDSDLDINSPSPIANSAVTAKFNELSGELADLFGDVDYDTSSKSIRFWDKGKTNVLASLDARPFIKDGMVSNVYISNNTLVITFNTDSGKEAIGVPLTSVFNPNNYYTKTQVDSRIASAVANINLSNYYTKSQTDTMVSRITPYEVTFTTGNNSNIVCDHTIANIYQNYTNHKPIIAKYGESVGTLVYIKGGENPEAAFLFGDRYDSPYLLRNGVSGWGKEELGADIEVEPWPSIESDKPVASDGVAAALAQKVSSVTINGTTKTPDEDGDVSFTVEGGSGGYEPPAGGIPKSDLAQSVQDTLDAVADKVDKETGKGLSTNDYTTAEKTKLQGIAEGAEVNVQSDWNQTTTSADDYIKNKPTLATVATSGSYNDLQDKPTIPAAYDDTTLSGRVTALENAGFLTTETDPNVPDWAKQQTKPAYTAQEVGALPASTTIPTKTSDLTNDSGFTSNTGTITGITMNGVSKGTSGVVDLGTVITAHQDISGKANASDVYTKTQTDTLLSGKLSKSDVSVETQGDGTVDINVGSGANKDTYTINLNHTHENMAKLVVCEESDLPSTLDNSTIYAITDSGETEIEKLIIRGMEFAGGGVPDTGEPMISSPSNGSTINLGDNTDGQGVSKVITIKGKHLTGDLTVAVGTGLTISYGQSTGQSSVTIPMAQALLGAQVTISYSGTGALDDGSLVISHGGSVLSSVVVVVVVVAPVALTAIKLTGTQWLQTDYYPNAATEFEMELKLTANSYTNSLQSTGNGIFLLRASNGTGSNRWDLNNGNADNADLWKLVMHLDGEVMGTDNVTKSNHTLFTTDHTIIKLVKTSSTQATFYFAGTAVGTIPLKSGTTTLPLAIGYNYQFENSDPIYKAFDLTIYRLTITENGSTVRNYVPMTLEGVPGLYDEIHDEFISSKTESDVVAVE